MYRPHHKQVSVEGTDIYNKLYKFECDEELVDILKALNVIGIKTVFSCCGKGRHRGYISWYDEDFDNRYAKALLIALKTIIAAFGKIVLERKFNKILNKIIMTARFVWRELDVR